MKYIKELNINFNDWDEVSDNSNEFKGHMDFYNFLIKNNILDSFLINFKHGYKWRNKLEIKSNNLFDYIKEVKIIEYISGAFLWDGTKEGYDFWWEKNEQWIKNK